ncbi:Zn-ribbon domain-containing OB-fold protein, partial [Thermodesulfobacteriota bacterium]
MTAKEYAKILPQPTPVDAPFWEAANKNELRLQRCFDCGHVWYPPSNGCSNCLSTDFTWEKMSGKGKIWSWVIFHKCYFPSFEADIPYNVISVKLEEGPLLTSNMVSCKNEDLICD